MLGLLRRSLFTNSAAQCLKQQIVQLSMKRQLNTVNMTRFEPIIMMRPQIQEFQIMEKSFDMMNGNITNNKIVDPNLIIPFGEQKSNSIDEIKADSVMRKRRKKMKKHKLRKRRREQRAMKKKLARG